VTLSSTPARGPAFGLGIVAGLATAIAYALLAEALGLTFGLVAVGFFGGMLIAAAVAYGAWRGAPHVEDRQLRLGAAAIAVASWLLGVFLAYAVSQGLLPQATTPLVERLAPDRFLEYILGLDLVIRLIHLVSLVAIVVMAWRGAR
jgi:hypothetical protein